MQKYLQMVSRVMTCMGIDYDLNSEKWRYWDYPGHSHTLDLVQTSKYGPTRTWFIDLEEIDCIFCQANTFDRTLEEILYHFNKTPNDKDFPGSGVVHRMLIDKWGKNIDAWDNPIGENIKG